MTAINPVVSTPSFLDPVTYDTALKTAQLALQGLSLRNNLISENVANVDTPSYTAQETNFESALQRATSGTAHLALKTTRATHIGSSSSNTELFQVGYRQGGTTRADGNNVDIDQELEQLAETGIRYMAVSQVVNQKLNILKNIASGG